MYIIDKNLCLGCAICSGVCPENAIYLIGRKADIDSSRCTDCGMCVSTCPRNAIKKQTSTVPEITALQKELENIKRSIDMISRNLDSLTNRTRKEVYNQTATSNYSNFTFNHRGRYGKFR